MSPYFEEFLVEFPRHGDAMGLTLGSLCSPIELSKYREELPATLLEFWTEVGWNGYTNGLKAMDFPDTLLAQIKNIWQRNLDMAASKGVSVSPEDFAMTFVDENFS